MFVFIIFISAIATTGQKQVKVKPNSILHVKLDYPIEERTPANPFSNFDFENFRPQIRLGLNDIVKNIKKAKQDNRINGIYLDLNIMPSGISTIDEIRNALLDFKESGKFIACHSDMLTQKAYYLSTAGDLIYLNPHGYFGFKGLFSENIYYKNALDKIGVEAQIFRGEGNIYKSAIEPFAQDSMSEESRRQTQTYVDSIWNYMLSRISEKRIAPPEKLNDIADNFRLKPGDNLTEYNLLDDYMYKDQFIKELKVMTNTPKEKDLRFISIERYQNVNKSKNMNVPGHNKKKIAVVYMTGEIMLNGDNNDNDVMNAGKIAEVIRKIRKDTAYCAIVLRINSVGGNALAAQIAWREVSLISKEMPVIASFSDVAASGAYYLATPADSIFARPTTLTGSIGVFGVVPNTKKLFNDKLGLTFDGVQTNKMSDIFSMHKPLSQSEKAVFYESINKVYQDFLEKVAEGRGMSVDEVHQLARGHVWCGLDAKRIGLVDQFGGLEECIETAAHKAGISNYNIVEWPREMYGVEAFMKGFGANIKKSFVKSELKDYYSVYKFIQNIERRGNIQARLPYSINIY